MARVDNAENFPVPAALRNGGVQGAAKVNATVHPDTWSYWYFNMLKMLFLDPEQHA